MIYIYRFFYAALLPFYILFGTLFFKKIRAWLNERPSTLNKNSQRQAIWIHASSGEFEHAKSVIRKIKERSPYERIVISYSSPSYHKIISKFEGVDEYVPLPVDTTARSLSIIKQINPKIVLFARTDVWPELVHQLKRKNIPTLLFANVANSPHGFFHKLAAKIIYNNLSHVSCVSESDLKNMTPSLTIPSSIDGDPRYDEAFYRKKNTVKKFENIKKIDKTLIVGSCWNEDYSIISNPIKKLLSEGGLNKVIFVPHEPNDLFTQRVREDFSVFTVGSFSDEKYDSQVLIVDTIGVLFELYSLADIAFVGGSFKKKVHSVLEPLSWGLPTLVGPKHKNSYEATYYSKDDFKFVTPVTDPKSFHDNIYRNIKFDKNIIETELLKGAQSADKIVDLIQSFVALGS